MSDHDTLHAAASDLRFIAQGGQCDPRTLLAHADALLTLTREPLARPRGEGVEDPCTCAGDEGDGTLTICGMCGGLRNPCVCTPAARGEAVAWALHWIDGKLAMTSANEAIADAWAIGQGEATVRPLVFGDTHPPRADAPCARCAENAAELDAIVELLGPTLPKALSCRPRDEVRRLLAKVADAPGATVTAAMVERAAKAMYEEAFGLPFSDADPNTAADTRTSVRVALTVALFTGDAAGEVANG